jgi:dTDP-L-rhamnose 4-epimerase
MTTEDRPLTTVLVNGGAGPLGSHVVDRLCRDGARVTVLDDDNGIGTARREGWLRTDVTYLTTDTLAGPEVEVLVQIGGAPVERAAVVAGTTLRRVVVTSDHTVYPEGASSCAEHGRFAPEPRPPAALAARDWEVHCPACGRTGSPAPTPEEHAGATPAFRREQRVKAWGAAHGIVTTVLRLPLVYGRRQPSTGPHAGFVARTAARLRRREQVMLYEDGAQQRDLVHAEDVARALVRLATDDRAAGRTYNVGTGAGTDLVGVVSTLAALLDVDGEVWLPGTGRAGDARHLIADVSRLRGLGWRPEVDALDGLEDYAAGLWSRSAG